MNEELIPIEQKIHEIRGEKVMLDFDLAELYQTETKRLKEQVRRNVERFPSDFMFELTKEEYNFLRSQIATLEKGKGKYSKYLPFAFTEQGIAMLSGVLNSGIAIEVNIKIMRAFVRVRRMLSSGNLYSKEIEDVKKEIRLIGSDINEIKEDISSLNKYQETNDLQVDDLFNAFAKLSNELKTKTAKLERVQVKGFHSHDKNKEEK
jgi:chromosome segregation ATPase